MVAHLDRVRIYTLHPDDVAIAQFSYHEIRGCTEIQFSNGGQLYALNDEDGHVHIFRFWQNERLDQVFKDSQLGHSGPVKSIVWLDDDTGFITAGRDDHRVIRWRIKPNEETGKVLVWSYKERGTQFYDCQIREEDPDKPNQPNKVVVLASSRDGCIRELLDGNSRERYETGYQYS